MEEGTIMTLKNIGFCERSFVMKKRWFNVLFALILVFSLTACGEKDVASGDESKVVSKDGQASVEQTSEASSENEDASSETVSDESLEKEDVLKLLEGKSIVGYEAKYPAGDYFPAEKGTIDLDLTLKQALEKYEDDQLFCVLIKTRSKYDDAKSEVVYEGETYEELYLKKDNSDEDAEKFSAVAKLYAKECKKRDMEFFKNEGIIVSEFGDVDDEFLVFATETQINELKVSTEQSLNAYLDTPDKLGEGKLEFEQFSTSVSE